MGDCRRAYVIDDEGLTRAMVQRLLTEADFIVLGFDSCESFLERHPNRPAGCIILDLSLPGMGGLELLEAIAADRAAFPVIVLSGTGSVPSAMRAGQLGVIEFIEKPFRIDQLLAAAQSACDLLRSRELSGVGALHRLTPREKELLISLGDGEPNKVVAYNLGLSVRTVEVYRANMIRKLGVRSLTQAVLIAREAGYL
ncbi:MAG: response regulator transcription factor [Allosphingosinicella sp.]